jgi:hypothetical protein
MELAKPWPQFGDDLRIFGSLTMICEISANFFDRCCGECSGNAKPRSISKTPVAGHGIPPASARSGGLQIVDSSPCQRPLFIGDYP